MTRERIAAKVKTNRWNHNLHYHPLILAAAPASCARALDVGCGEGVLTRELRSVSQHVVGIDLDSRSIELARTRGGEGLEYIVGDFLEHPFEPASFDLTLVLRKRYWQHSAPTLWPPPLSYSEVRSTATRLLPGVEHRRHVLWRYSLVWTRPQSD